MSIAIAHRESSSLRGKPWRQGLGDTERLACDHPQLSCTETARPDGAKVRGHIEELEAMDFTGLMWLTGKKDAQK